MSLPILARVRAAGRLVRAAARVLAPRAAGAVTPATVTEFQTGAWWAHRRMSPAEARLILDQAARGDLAAQWDLLSLMEDTWPRLAKNLGELRRAAARATYTVNPYAVRGQPATATAKDRAAFVDSCLRQWWPKPGTLELSFESTLFNALDAYGKGVSALEIHWERRPEGVMPRASHVLGPRRFGWNDVGTELGLIATDDTAPGARAWQPFPADRFLVGIWQARTGAPGATAALRPLVPYWAGITFGWEWLLANAQLFGVPFRWATYDRQDPALATVLRDMLAEMGAVGYGAFPEGTKLEFKEAAQNVTGNPQVVIQELADKACDLLILGQELSGGAQAAGLGGGAAGLQGAVRADRLQDAAAWCADLLNYQLVPALLRLNYGDTAEPPTIVADVDEEPDPLKLAQRDQVLLNAGIELPRAWFFERHAIPEPVGGEAVIVGRPQADPFAVPGAPGQPGLPAPRSPLPALMAKVSAEAVQADLAEATKRAAVRALVTKARPILAQLRRAADSGDDAAYDQALAQASADLRAHAARLGLGADDPLVQAIYGGLSAAAINGAAAGQQSRPAASA